MGKHVTIRAKALGGQWETIGVDRAAGIWAEEPAFESDWWGPSKASFTLKRDGRRAFPDLSTYTPIDALVGEKPVWAGRTSETPNGGANLSTSVQCDGAQYHLDDALYENFYVHSRLGDWKDSRTMPGVNLASLLNRFTVTAGAGAIQIGCTKDTEWPTGTTVGVTLDLGPAAVIRGMSLDFDSVPGLAGLNLYLRVTTTPDAFTGSYDMLIWPATPGGPIVGYAPAGYRYAHIFLYNPGATFTPANDAFVTLKGASVYADADYVAATGFAILKASDVIQDALNYAPLLSDDLSQIAATSTQLNDFYVDGPRPPRDFITNANAFHNYKLLVDARRRMVFQPRPAAPIYEIGSWSGASVDDLSANAGDAIYDRVIVKATDPAGQPVRVTRDAAFAVATTRQGFHRVKLLDVGFALPADGVLAAAIGDAWLGQNYLTPMKGTIKVREGDVRNILTGATVPLEDLLGASSQMVRLMDRHDPDTGGWGRDARIAGAKWMPATGEAEITIDNTRANFEALLQRLAVVGGG